MTYEIEPVPVLSSTSKRSTSGVSSRSSSTSRAASRSTTERLTPPELATQSESLSRLKARPQGSEPTPIAVLNRSDWRSKTSSWFVWMLDR